MNRTLKISKTTFSNLKTTLDDKCVICYERPRRAKVCYECRAIICDTCLFELLDNWKSKKCPYCRAEINEDAMLNAWQERYITQKTKTQLYDLTEEIKKLKLDKDKKETTSIQLLVHRWVENYLKNEQITNKTFEQELLQLTQKYETNKEGE